jgi:hypothetical protein
MGSGVELSEMPGISDHNSLDSSDEEGSTSLETDFYDDESGEEDLVESIALAEIYDDWSGIDSIDIEQY